MAEDDARASGAGAARSSSDGAPPRAPRHGPGLESFLTDGSLARLCDELGLLLGVRIELRTEDGRRIVSAPGIPPWCAVEEIPPEDARRIELRAEGATIGALLVAEDGAGPVGESPESRSQRIDRALAWLASAVGELADNVIELRHRVREVEALLQLTGMMARTDDVDAIIRTALDLALSVLDLDKGSIVMFREEAEGTARDSEVDLTLSASRGLSEGWLTSPLPLSKERLFDRLAREGQIVVSEDVQRDERILIPERARAEGVASVINAGIVSHGRALGVMRCYGTAPRHFSEPDRRVLASIAQQTAIAVEQARLIQARQRESRNQRQLQLAGDVQRRMLPMQAPRLGASLGVDLAARYQPSSDLGGDFYDVFAVGSNLGLVIGDVVGKGVPAALLMAAVRATLRAHVQDLYNLDEVISRVNSAMCRDTLESEFATLWYGVLDPATRRLTYCSAGHEPPMIVRVPGHRAPTKADLDELTLGGMVVGIDPSQRYQRGIYDLGPGDVLVAYTDGVTDLRNFDQQRYGKNRLQKSLLSTLAESPGGTSEAISERLLWGMRQFAGLAPQADDMTLLVVRV